ncbi:hypothetical protein CampHawk_207 [Bacillus phage CampHawk]|uniref:Uncharacterized protein n=1 Tax=Bacillus phage CampHawk TaxID=1406783 RepID=U5PT22_9CAUD|nr:hypothetical protein CampHawk_6 [Bacillus phage CampHawk]YP_008770141.1 hypothetical protein CampHawk_207 [Bacillus phage CampHawk]AGY46884.1 hypothetical protein CampHawk_6 [Bacillus phage CampHawk]AGY47085.1 hypothetical protein CampHawk_207 [Bacillus phage CampHawk]
MDLQITHNGKTFVMDPLGDAKPGAYVLYLSEYRQGHASVGQIKRVDDTGVLFLQDVVVGLDQPYILLKEHVDVDDLIEEEDDDSLDTDLRESLAPRAPKPTDQPPRELTSQERQLEQWTTMTRVFSHDLKKGVPYAIKHKHPEEVFYGLYSGLLNPVTALFRYLSGEYKVSIQQLEAGVVEIHEIVEDKEEF